VGGEVAAVGDAFIQLGAVELAVILGVNCKFRAPEASIAVVTFLGLPGVTICPLPIVDQMLSNSLLVLCHRLRPNMRETL